MGKTHNDSRTDQILELVVAGLTRREILKWVSSKTDWKIGDRQVDRLISRTRTLLEKEAAPHRTLEFAKAVRRLDMLFAAACRSMISRRAWPSKRNASSC